MITIIQTINLMPHHFKSFCSILTLISYYGSLVKSLVMCYVVYDSEMQFQKYIEIDKIILQFKASLTNSELLELTAENADSGADTGNKRRKEHFIAMMHTKSPKFISELMKYLALEDCPNHSELYHNLQRFIDVFCKSLCIPSAISFLPGIKRYQNVLKMLYTDMAKVDPQNTFPDNLQKYINLSLIMPQNQEDNNDYLKALQDPHHLLFNHKKYTRSNTTMLTSLAEIFDTSRLTPQIVLAQGSPGSGKTTLANKMCTEWAKGNFMQQYMLVILLKLRDPRISDIESIDELINCTMDNKFVSEVAHEIKCIDGQSILLLLEGWDELPVDKQYKSFFTNVISGKALKKGNVLITSRPSSIGSIQQRFITRHVAILGFSEDQIEQYLDCCFADSGNELKDNLKYRFLLQLNSNPTLKCLAYVPVNLSILVHVFRQYGGKLPSTLTELYQQYVLLKLTLYNHRISDNKVRFIKFDNLPVYILESLNKLCELAYGGLKDQKLHFTQNEMQKQYQSVPLDNDGMGLLQVENHMLHRGSYKTYHFIHKTVQEFLAAWHMAQISEQRINITEHFQDMNFEIALIFYAGLTGFKNLDYAKFLPFIDSHNNKRSRVMKLVDEAGILLVKVFLKSYNTGNFLSLYAGAGMYSEVKGHGLLVLIACCAEAKNPAACRALSTSGLFHNNACYISVPYSVITPQLLCLLSYCIAHSTKDWIVQCDHLSEQDIVSLQKHLFDLDINSGKLISLTTITTKREIDFLVAFLQPHFSLFHLNLSDSHEFGDYCATLLAKALELNHTLAILSLNHCDISSTGILAIAEMLQINRRLEIIHLEENTFTCDGVIQVLLKIKNNITLTFMIIDASLQKLQIVEKQLILFNRRRRNPLRLNIIPLSFFQ